MQINALNDKMFIWNLGEKLSVVYSIKQKSSLNFTQIPINSYAREIDNFAVVYYWNTKFWVRVRERWTYPQTSTLFWSLDLAQVSTSGCFYPFYRPQGIKIEHNSTFPQQAVWF